MDALQYIKRLVFNGRVDFTQKALDEIEEDRLRVSDVLESLLNAQTIKKVLRSTSRFRRAKGEKLYVIQSFNFSGTCVYTKGAIRREEGQEVFYVLISSKVATFGE